MAGRKGKKGRLIPVEKWVTRVVNGKTQRYLQRVYINPDKYNGITKKFNDLIAPVQNDLRKITRIGKQFFEELDKQNPDWDKLKNLFEEYVKTKIEAGSKFISRNKREQKKLKDRRIPELIKLMERGEATGINMMRVRAGMEQDGIYKDYDILFTGAYANSIMDIITGSQFGRPSIRLFKKAIQRLAFERPDLYSKIDKIDAIPRVSSFNYQYSWMGGVLNKVKDKLKELTGKDGFPHFDLEVMLGIRFKKNEDVTRKDIQDLVDYIQNYMARSSKTEKMQPIKVGRGQHIDDETLKILDRLGYVKDEQGMLYTKKKSPNSILWETPDIRVNADKFNLPQNGLNGFKEAVLNKVKVTDRVMVTTLTPTKKERLINLLNDIFGGNVDIIRVLINNGLYGYISSD